MKTLGMESNAWRRCPREVLLLILKKYMSTDRRLATRQALLSKRVHRTFAHDIPRCCSHTSAVGGNPAARHRPRCWFWWRLACRSARPFRSGPLVGCSHSGICTPDQLHVRQRCHYLCQAAALDRACILPSKRRHLRHVLRNAPCIT